MRRDQYRGYPLRYIHGHNQTGKRANGWKGGRKVNDRGYILVFMPGHHLANNAGYVPEHRLEWEKANNRRLTPAIHVHHIDGNPSNNDPANLIALTKTQHTAVHASSKITSQRLSEAKRRWDTDPEARRKHSERMKRWWADRKSAH